MKDKIAHTPDKLVKYSALFEEIKHHDQNSLFYYIIFFARRIIFAFGLVMFYQNSQAQILVCIMSSVSVLIYLFMVMPYKARILNVFTIFNEA